MYFLEQVLKHSSLLIALRLWVEWPSEVQQDMSPKTPEAQKTPWEVLDKAQKVSWSLDSAVSAEEKRFFELQWDWSDSLSKPLHQSSDTKAILSNLSVSDNELSAVRAEFPWDVSEEVIRQRVLENKLEAYNNWEISDEDTKVIHTLFSDAGLANIPSEISTDQLQDWEVSDIGKEATPQELENAHNQVGEEVKKLDTQIARLAQSPEREILEKRRWLIWSILNILEWKHQQWWVGWMWFAWVESNGSHNVVSTAKNHLGIHENSWNADKFLMWLAQNARKTPWCGGFVSYVCKEAGYDINPTLSSKAFIWETGKWHVAFNVWWWLMLWWNQSNKVSIQSINKPIAWWIMPEDYAAGKSAQKSWNAPVWAIIVFDRWSSQSNWA